MRRSALSRLPPPLRGRLMSTRSRWRTGELTRGLFLSGTTATRLPGDCAAHIDAFGSDVLPTAGAVRVDVAAISELGDTDLVVGVCEESCVGRAWGVSLLRRALVTAAVDRRAQQALRRQHANAEMAHRARLEAGTAPPLAADRERRTRGSGHAHGLLCFEIEGGELTFYSDGERVDLPPLRGLPPAVRPWARLSAAGDSAEILQEAEPARHKTDLRARGGWMLVSMRFEVFVASEAQRGCLGCRHVTWLYWHVLLSVSWRDLMFSSLDHVEIIDSRFCLNFSAGGFSHILHICVKKETISPES
ncbi:hypothetical protein EMIHUDRAFT_197199 [Emiliania huxleyi CCMP1516]|uniref:B30.2/SPRY domain-containing protein n=2 Tax=Emiliania huxleyi TaxID=2903 RepID=A0A0D3ITV6_EMIH1|nr:hypothetical protein EMIHUDRAFT_197199 [Emiliania huxleyi CCMP1516]EOD14691.1 hypothetical protein EMIHUDRAFT_197199 [Emiliania huxleyi CCMP1516]|eukprot:XP_005767120.1 hypothetical protein EMIHUDRAFT_197199 [Emiliania huxleyi CCMP1516]